MLKNRKVCVGNLGFLTIKRFLKNMKFLSLKKVCIEENLGFLTIKRCLKNMNFSSLYIKYHIFQNVPFQNHHLNPFFSHIYL
jgi:hypothetical protein